jgi:hypothetical protein
MTPEEIVRRHGATDCTCLRDDFPCDKCRMLMDDIAAALDKEREGATLAGAMVLILALCAWLASLWWFS